MESQWSGEEQEDLESEETDHGPRPLLPSPAPLLCHHSSLVQTSLLGAPIPGTGKRKDALARLLSTHPSEPYPRQGREDMGLSWCHPFPSPLRTLGAGRARPGLAETRTYDHGTVGDLLDEALLLQLADLEVERVPGAHQRQQLPQQQRQGHTGCPRCAPSPPGASPGPSSSRPAGPRHLPGRVLRSPRGACGDCKLAYGLQLPGALAWPRPRRVPADPRC